MKKTLSINIGGFVFIIDEDAYQILASYIEKLTSRYKSVESGEEIIADIEARIAELFQQKLAGRQVVVAAQVTEVIAQLGTPEDFEDETENPVNPVKKEKIIFRDPLNRLIGGVCGGLGNYLGISANIIRIVFLFAFLFYGSGVLIYIILWIIMPLAKTTSQKLIMKGEKITIQNIEKSIKQEFNQVKNSFLRWKNAPNTQNFKDSASGSLNVFFSVLKAVATVIVFITGIFLVLFGLMTILFIILAPILTDTFLIPNAMQVEGINLFGLATILTSHTNIILAYISSILLGVLPMLAAIYVGIKLILRIEHRNQRLNITMLGLWIIGIILSVVVTIRIIGDYKVRTDYEITEDVQTNSDTIFVKTTDNEELYSKYENYEQLDFDGALIFVKDGDKEVYIKPRLDIRKSKNDKITIEYNIRANANTRREGLEYCKDVDYLFYQNDSILNFSQYFTYKQNNKWHGEKVDIILYLPVNKYVYLNETSRSIIFDIHNRHDMWDYDMVEKMWKMTDSGLILADKDSIATN